MPHMWTVTLSCLSPSWRVIQFSVNVLDPGSWQSFDLESCPMVSKSIIPGPKFEKEVKIDWGSGLQKIRKYLGIAIASIGSLLVIGSCYLKGSDIEMSCYCHR
ncbi:hypothetical protein M434DRAFT_396725 [Hypoxylon sp. CO27-5]|nr:hypothetical protein M434DRAFT_396725 [Hypoxylon sp. CO27-5]